ncbi:hypothetical protein FKM82_026114 [Ascaphus truei]
MLMRWFLNLSEFLVHSCWENFVLYVVASGFLRTSPFGIRCSFLHLLRKMISLSSCACFFSKSFSFIWVRYNVVSSIFSCRGISTVLAELQ